MIEGPVGAMVERNHAKQGFQAPPKLMDVRPAALETPEASLIVLICSDPRLNPGEILALNENPGNYHLPWILYCTNLTYPGPMASFVRVPGGRAAEAIKSLAVMQGALNSGTIVVIHHTGMKETSLNFSKHC